MVRKIASVLMLLFFCFFGIITCAYYAYVTEMICSQSSYLWAVCAPLLLIAPANAACLMLNPAKPPGKKTLFLLGTLNCMALIVSTLLLIVLLPLVILANIGFVASIVGLLSGSISTAFANMGFCAFYIFVAAGPLLTAVYQRLRLQEMAPQKKPWVWMPLSTCAALILSAIIITVFPTALTRTCSNVVANRSMVAEGLLLLRAAGNDEELLRACYSEESPLPWFFQFLGSDWSRWWTYGDVNTQARELYYRVKGRPFNSVPRPFRKHANYFLPLDPFSSIMGSATYDDTDEDQYSWNDRDFAGEAVGGIVRGLNLSQSTISGWVDPNEAIAHLSWSMNFHCTSRGKELRAQLLLPPHAVVTGCRLWVNGVPHDAIFATRESSRKAYTETAHSGEKPLLVSTAGAGRVLVQSPTGWWGADAKLTVEFTTPLTILSPDKAALPLPIFTERNFAVPAEHLLTLTSTTPAASTNKGLQVRSLKSQMAAVEISGKLTSAELSAGEGAVTLQWNPASLTVVAEDPIDKKHDVVQEIRSQPHSAKTPLIVVLDGSTTMADWTNKICDALEKADARDATVIWASDLPKVVLAHRDTSSPQWKECLDTLRDSSALGGQNNAEALTLAIENTDGKSEANIVWLHGPQPVGFTGDVLLPLLERSQGRIKLYEYQMMPGPNEVIKSLDRSSALVQVPRLGSTSEDLTGLLLRLSGQSPAYVVDRHLADHASSGATSSKHPAEIAQLCASDLVFSNLSKPGLRSTYGTLAERHGLVTPLTSALVLEHENYAQHQVEKHEQQAPGKIGAASAGTSFHLPGTSDFIPAKPEPPVSLLVCCAFIAIGLLTWMRRKREKQA